VGHSPFKLFPGLVGLRPAWMAEAKRKRPQSPPHPPQQLGGRGGGGHVAWGGRGLEDRIGYPTSSTI